MEVYLSQYFANIFFAYLDTAMMDMGISGTHASSTKATCQSIHTVTTNKMTGANIA